MICTQYAMFVVIHFGYWHPNINLLRMLIISIGQNCAYHGSCSFQSYKSPLIFIHHLNTNMVVFFAYALGPMVIHIIIPNPNTFKCNLLYLNPTSLSVFIIFSHHPYPSPAPPPTPIPALSSACTPSSTCALPAS